jgi:ABC-type molybdenum transport system ATPase subunit/photorepair protein PhrA
MDTNGSEELIKILHNFDHDTNVFVISHKSENLYDKFHSAIRFQKTKNFSTMV